MALVRVGAVAPVLGLVGILSLAARGAEPTLAARFADPPKDVRILKIIHSWPDAAEARRALIEGLDRQGFGGVVCNVGFDDYLESPAKWKTFEAAVAAAKAAGWALWLYDERGYPSGNAGGLVLRDHPEWEARGLLIADAETRGEPVEVAVPPGSLVLAEAYPIGADGGRGGPAVDLAGRIEAKSLRWSPTSPGRWVVRVVTEDRLYEGTHADGNLWRKMPYINLLQREPTAKFLEVTHDRYAAHLGADLGRAFVATFTDEPSLMSLFLRPMPYRVLPWSAGLPEEFARRRGYAVRSALPDLVGPPGPEGLRHRHDFWLTVGELVSENFFGQIQDWCHQHNIRSGGHLLAEEGLVGHVPLYGDFFRCARRLDAPSIDCLTSVPAEVPWSIARLLASAAELEGKDLVMSEASDHGQQYRPPGDTRPARVVTEAEIRGSLNRQMVAGVNRFTSYYRFAGLPDEALNRLNEWVGRCALLLTGGYQAADVAVVYPVESIWVRFEPSRHMTAGATAAQPIEALYRGATEGLFAARRDYTVVDARTLAGAKAEGGVLRHGDLAWRVVVLPGVDTLPLAAWENLAAFVRGGGVVVALGSRPANSEREFPSPRVAALAAEVFGPESGGPTTRPNAAGGAGLFLPAGSEAMLPLILDGLLEADVATDPARGALRSTHRRIDGHEVYFLVNDANAPWSGTVRLAPGGPGERFDPGTGTVAPIADAHSIPLDLPPYGATLIRLPLGRAPARRPVAAGVLPNLDMEPIPVGTPRAIRGEFVRAEVVSAGESRWSPRGVLTRGGVDTFLFADFPCAPPADLSGADCLVVETDAPAGQRTGTNVLVILHEEGGGDFLASTGRSLAAAGPRLSVIPLDRFALMSGKADADGRLDLSRVSAVRIGWGGYFGAEGEVVTFEVAAPRVGRLATPPASPNRREAR
jgi:hypothetical protein